jgi:hypothetical protein
VDEAVPTKGCRGGREESAWVLRVITTAIALDLPPTDAKPWSLYVGRVADLRIGNVVSILSVDAK